MLYGTYPDWATLHTALVPQVPLTDLTLGALENVYLGSLAVEYVRDKIPIPWNAKDMPLLVTRGTPYFDGVKFLWELGQPSKLYKEMSTEVGLRCKDQGITLDSAYGDYMRVTGQVAAAKGVGNCGEMVALAYTYLIGHGLKGKVEVINCEYQVGYDTNNHALIAIARDPGSDVTDFRSYGAKCALCDPWLDVCACPAAFAKLFKKINKEVELSLKPVKARRPEQTVAEAVS